MRSREYFIDIDFWITAVNWGLAKPELYLAYRPKRDNEEIIFDISVEQAKDIVKFLQSFIDEVEK